MPAAKKRQSNAIFYTLLTFVGLFIATTTFAVIYYVKYEDQKKIADDAKTTLAEVADARQQQKFGSLVGEKERQQSWLGATLDYFDQVTEIVLGTPIDETSAEIKLKDIKKEFKNTLDMLSEEELGIENTTPNSSGLVRIMQLLKSKLDNVQSNRDALKEQLNTLQVRFDDTQKAHFEQEQVLLGEKEKYQLQVVDIRSDYNDLKQLLQQTSEDRVSNLLAQRDEERDRSEQLQDQLLKTEAEYKQAENRMQLALKELREIKPLPSIDALAYKTDGRIVMINDEERIVYLNLGIKDRIYRGLTFSVYEQNVPIPENGRGKAEIEVFDVKENISAAKIIRSEMKRPIVYGDAVANLIWDTDKTNVFMVVGEFDIDGDGNIDSEGSERIKELIEQWGGKVTEDISIQTDYVVLGDLPKALPKPTYEEVQIYPLAMDEYKKSLDERQRYQKAQEKANALSIPIFKTERFLYMSGYKTLSTKAATL